MLEWTHRKIQNKSQGFSSLADAYDDLLYEYKDGKIPVEHEYTIAFDTENNGRFVEKLSVNKKVEEMASGSFKLE